MSHKAHSRGVKKYIFDPYMCLVRFICLMAYQPLMGNFMSPFYSFAVITILSLLLIAFSLLVYNHLFRHTIGLVGRVWANGPGDPGSIPGRVIPKTLKMVLYLTLSILRYVSRVKWSNPGKGVAPSPTPRGSSYWKGSFQVTLVNSRQLYLLLYGFKYSYLILTIQANIWVQVIILIWSFLWTFIQFQLRRSKTNNFHIIICYSRSSRNCMVLSN